jgi:hypothetical protein
MSEILSELGHYFSMYWITFFKGNIQEPHGRAFVPSVNLNWPKEKITENLMTGGVEILWVGGGGSHQKFLPT